MNERLAAGTRVRVIEPDNWKTGVANKIRNRTGVVWSDRGSDYIVDSPAEGRRKHFWHHFIRRDLEVIE